MNSRRPGWTSLLKQDGPDFLAWVRDEDVLSRRLDILATALSSLLHVWVRTQEDAHDVWAAVPEVLSRCNEQATYEKPGAVAAYAWIHLLDRYVRTWLALERLVQSACLPMGRDGVRALDVGTGPGPAAFGIHDFYATMVQYSDVRNKPRWRQPSDVTCMEIAPGTNRFRHQLAEVLFECTQMESKNVLSMCSALGDFRDFEPVQERKRFFETLRTEYEYYDDAAKHWHSEPIYLPDEANSIAQSLHRYRLIVFSNFLTTLGTVDSFESNLVDALHDANPGTVLLVLGGTGGDYHEVYEYVDRLAQPSRFQLAMEGETVSCSDSEVACKVYDAGREFYESLQRLDKNNDDATRKVREHFKGKEPIRFASSEIRAYRKR